MTALNRSMPLQLDVRDLRLVAAVAEAGNLSRAARVLHLTQSTLSHHLADLETRLGGPLFSRLGRRLELTPLGERLRNGAVPLLASLRGLEDDLRSFDERESRIEVRFATECYTIYPWLARVVPPLREQFNNIDVRIVAEATARPLDALDRGALDMAIVSGAVRDRRYHQTKLFRDELVAVVPPDHPWSRRSHVDADDFRDIHLLLYAPEPMESSFVRQKLLPAGVVPRTMSGVPLTEGLLELSKSSVGIAVLARWAAASQLRDGALTAVRIGRTGMHREWSAVRPHAHPHRNILDAFAALIRQFGPSSKDAAANQ